MAKFAPVAPVQVLEGLYAAGEFGDYHLLLAHHTVEHKARFRDLFNRAYDDGWSGTVIMDNSIVELGDSVSLDMIAEAVTVVKGNQPIPNVAVYPVLPDVMGKGEATREIVAKEYPSWVEQMPGDGFMVVCQGSDFQDYLSSLKVFGDANAYPDIEVLGIPRVLQRTCGTRIRAVLSAKDYLDTHLIHLLGFSDDIADDIDSAKLLSTCGIDSAVPLRFREVFTEFIDAGKRPTDWFETAQVDRLMIDNLNSAGRLFAD